MNKEMLIHLKVMRMKERKKYAEEIKKRLNYMKRLITRKCFFMQKITTQ